MLRSKRILLAAFALAGMATLLCCGGPKVPKPSPAADAMNHYRMGQALFKSGRLSESAAEMEQATALAPTNAEMANFRGQVLLLAGRYPQAEKALLRALELDPNMTDVHNNLGMLCDRTGRKSEAEEQYRMALADLAFPSPEKVHLNLGNLYASEGRDEDAIRELRKAVEIDPKFYPAHYELAGRLDAAGKLDESAREYEVAAPDYRMSAEYHYRLGLVYLRLKDKGKATDHLRKVVELSPGSENAARADEILKVTR